MTKYTFPQTYAFFFIVHENPLHGHELVPVLGAGFEHFAVENQNITKCRRIMKSVSKNLPEGSLADLRHLFVLDAFITELEVVYKFKENKA